jgi:hypothetical protein
MNQEKDETIPMEEEVRIIKSVIIKTKKFHSFIVYLLIFRIKISVLQVKQQLIVVQINIKIKQMMMKKMNQFMSNQVHVLVGRNDEKQFVNFSIKLKYKIRFFKVAQRDIPGIDASYLAMDTEEGVEVVWNEVLFSERKISDIQHVKFPFIKTTNVLFEIVF